MNSKFRFVYKMELSGMGKTGTYMKFMQYCMDKDNRKTSQIQQETKKHPENWSRGNLANKRREMITAREVDLRSTLCLSTRVPFSILWKTTYKEDLYD